MWQRIEVPISFFFQAVKIKRKKNREAQQCFEIIIVIAIDVLFGGRGVVLLLFNLRVNCKAQVTAIMGTREFGCWVDNVCSAVSMYLMPKTANRNTLNCENYCFFLCSSY